MVLVKERLVKCFYSVVTLAGKLCAQGNVHLQAQANWKKQAGFQCADKPFCHPFGISDVVQNGLQ
jgi:hypothetical protein